MKYLKEITVDTTEVDYWATMKYIIILKKWIVKIECIVRHIMGHITYLIFKILCNINHLDPSEIHHILVWCVCYQLFIKGKYLRIWLKDPLWKRMNELFTHICHESQTRAVSTKNTIQYGVKLNMIDASLLVVSMHINNAPEWCVEYEGNLKLGFLYACWYWFRWNLDMERWGYCG